MNFKNLSFGALTGMFLGGIAVLMIGTFVVMKIMYSGNQAAAPKASIVTPKKSSLADELQRDPLGEQLQLQQKATEAAEAVADAKVQAILEATQEQNHAVIEQLQSVAVGVEAINHRVTELENARAITIGAAGVKIIKPEKKDAHQKSDPTNIYSPLPKSPDNKIVALVGSTAWIADRAGNLTTYSVGDTLLTRSGKVVIKSIDHKSNTVLVDTH